MTLLTSTFWRSIVTNRALVMCISLCWLLMSNVAFVHAQQHYASSDYNKEHTATPDFQCQLCISAFHFTPFITSSTLPFNVVVQSIESEAFVSVTYIEGYKQLPSNRDPPNH